MPSLCQTCIEHDCATSEWLQGVTECERYRPPYGFIECDICRTPKSPFDLQRVKVDEKTLLVCPGCVGDAVALLIDTIKEATQEAQGE